MMNDYEFGNRLYKLRVEAKMSQNDLAKILNVTNKSVSKWETGKAKPNLDTLNRLSIIFKVPIDELLNEKKAAPQISRIVITGGPCAGKSTAMSWIQKEFTKLGYHVIFINESATELINAGVNMNACASKLEFQKAIMELQRKKEEIYYQAALKMNKEKILLICDRGTLDSKAYVNDLEFQNLLRVSNTNEIELRDNYDAVFHLVTAAKGAREYYTLDNNPARGESVEEAIKADEKILQAWMGHPHLRVIDKSTDFNTKLQRLMNEITSFLGEPEPYEIERKYLIEFPDLKLLDEMKNCNKVNIIQTYLLSDKNEEVRVRQRGIDGNYIYYKTIKKKVSGIKRLEIEKRLTKDQYLELLMNQDPNYKQIKKTRYCLMYNDVYYEIDVFPFWNDKAIMEVELKDENDMVEFPPFINIIKEVSDDDEYKNHSLARI